MNDHDRLARYVQRYYRRNASQPPTVRRCARALGWAMGRVEDAVEGDPRTRFYLTHWTRQEVPTGDYLVELIEQD